MTRKALFAPSLLPEVIRLTHAAGDLVMQHYRQGHPVDRKADESPVTEADRAADRLIVAGLKALTPTFPIVSEEGDKPDVSQADYFWLVDPLDGTKSFIRGKGDFTVNLGLIKNEDSVPVLGTVYDPQHQSMYWGDAQGAFRQRDGEQDMPIHTRRQSETLLSAFVSHTNLNAATEEYLTARGVAERIPCASSIKFCRLAEGLADFYPRFSPTMEWDTAAGHAVLLAAGGSVIVPPGNEPLRYNKPGFLNGNFVAMAADHS